MTGVSSVGEEQRVQTKESLFRLGGHGDSRPFCLLLHGASPLLQRGFFSCLGWGTCCLFSALRFYRSAGDETLHECPEGTLGYLRGATQRSQCYRCPPGVWCRNELSDSGESTPTVSECPEGHYCPPYGGSVPCPAGKPLGLELRRSSGVALAHLQ